MKCKLYCNTYMHGLYCILLDEIVDFPLHTAMKKLVLLNVNRTGILNQIINVMLVSKSLNILKPKK